MFEFLTEPPVFIQVKSQQAEVIRILDSKSIQYELIDISVGGELRDEMRSKAGDPTAVPPQLFNEDQYCGVRGHIISHLTHEVVKASLHIFSQITKVLVKMQTRVEDDVFRI